MTRKHPRSSPESSPKAPSARKTRAKTAPKPAANATDAPRTKRAKSRVVVEKPKRGRPKGSKNAPKPRPSKAADALEEPDMLDKSAIAYLFAYTVQVTPKEQIKRKE